MWPILHKRHPILEESAETHFYKRHPTISNLQKRWFGQITRLLISFSTTSGTQSDGGLIESVEECSIRGSKFPSNTGDAKFQLKNRIANGYREQLPFLQWTPPTKDHFNLQWPWPSTKRHSKFCIFRTMQNDFYRMLRSGVSTKAG
jgi:hypothetical protein